MYVTKKLIAKAVNLEHKVLREYLRDVRPAFTVGVVNPERPLRRGGPDILHDFRDAVFYAILATLGPALNPEKRQGLAVLRGKHGKRNSWGAAVDGAVNDKAERKDEFLCVFAGDSRRAPGISYDDGVGLEVRINVADFARRLLLRFQELKGEDPDFFAQNAIETVKS